MDELLTYYKNALVNGLCDEYKGYWQAAKNVKKDLVRLAMQQQSIPHFATYAHQGKGLTKGYLLREFGDYINGYLLEDCDGVKGYTYALYVDAFLDVLVRADVSHFMWCNGATINVPSTKCPTIYISNKSDVTITSDGYNTIKIYLFDESHVTIDDLGEDSEVVIYKYSERCGVSLGKFCFANVKQHDKELRL